MVQHVAFLRGINVGGKAIIPMADLREVFDELGFRNTHTLLQSGNVVFDAGRAAPTALPKKIEAALAKRFGRDTRVVVRTPKQLAATVARNPFAAAARDDPGHLVVFFLTGKPAAAKALAQLKPAEPFRLDGTELFIHYKAGIGTSKFTGAVIERTLGVQGTARNWNTINKLVTLAAEIKGS
jgi:uncharacterized protein (DUF1697 family)